MMSKIVLRVLRIRSGPGIKYYACKQKALSPNYPIFGSRQYVSPNLGSDTKNSSEENKRTISNLYNLSVNIKKIRQLKGWVLSKDVAFVQETADFLKGLGANEPLVANILERCPEAFLQDPAEVKEQRYIWHLVCPNDDELVQIIEKFPDSFFVYKSPENQRDNIAYFKDLGLSNKIICRLLTSSPQIFCNPIEDNKQIIDGVKENFLNLGGSEANFKTWLMKMLSQDPFIMFKSSSAIKENVKFLQSLGFSDTEILKLMSKLKGMIFDLSCSTMEESTTFSRSVFNCDDEELRQMILKCPGILYYSVSVLEDRLKCLIREGASVDQVKKCPNVLELTTQIIEFRIKKMKSLGHEIQNQHLDVLNGTKKDFEVNFGRLQVKKERPLFNPVAPLHVDE
ncbi:transcription termination factor 2, mitochondrial [Spea bombifrons]|uniref:transcription termination factor 2, mitochondrial n=1 Tax=Spea bombifrons TaxID=233779 RepID=UPI00234A906C|nr:transcription termination factor 2, mitochondrial [Spea bombifrons]XP_053321639.1 transcription termination factor 2, mitochondrial [Spea bombifrons]